VKTRTLVYVGVAVVAGWLFYLALEKRL